MIRGRHPPCWSVRDSYVRSTGRDTASACKGHPALFAVMSSQAASFGIDEEFERSAPLDAWLHWLIDVQMSPESVGALCLACIVKWGSEGTLSCLGVGGRLIPWWRWHTRCRWSVVRLARRASVLPYSRPGTVSVRKDTKSRLPPIKRFRRGGSRAYSPRGGTTFVPPDCCDEYRPRDRWSRARGLD